MRIGYARCSTVRNQDVEEQIEQLVGRGVERDDIYIDRGFTGTTRDRPGLDAAMRAVRTGETLVVTSLDRLGRSTRDLAEIADSLERKGVRLEYGGTTYDPADPMGRMMFQMLAVFAEFEAALIRQRTVEGVARAKAAGKYKGRKPKLNDRQRALMWELYDERGESVGDLAQMFGLSESGVYKYLRREREARRNSSAEVR